MNMTSSYPSGKQEICEWLRANSAGVYRPAAFAADLIEEMERDKNWALAERNRAEQEVLEAREGYTIGRQKLLDEIAALRKEKARDEEKIQALERENAKLRTLLARALPLLREVPVHNTMEAWEHSGLEAEIQMAIEQPK